MKLTTAFCVVAALLLSTTFAAPAGKQPAIATTNSLEGYPKLSGLDGRVGMANLDPDGVYRLYLANGTVVDAARVTLAQIQTWVDVRAPYLSEADANAERVIYASSNPEAVPDAQLLTPSEDLKPKSQLERLMQTEISLASRSPLLEKREPNCPLFYCVNTAYVCYNYKKCTCGGAICVHFD
ncbi:hypothetical protein LTR97_003380 [Elasticomyces elasticus]|uniref:Secreted protein n=1 Tax=Elasticomyces elasticus TaxID=574655 RepID=A0AAN7WEB9_9PEZI|nr:hypothetical protein LTR97_003380 [Elasticomyces elasticus]